MAKSFKDFLKDSNGAKITAEAADVLASLYGPKEVEYTNSSLTPDIPEISTGIDQVPADRGVKLNKVGSSNAIPIIFGPRRVGGTIVFMDTTGTNNEYLHLVMTLCEGPIQGASVMWWGENVFATSSDNGATWNFGPGYGAVTHIEFYDGFQNTACSTLVAENIGWTNNHIGVGVAYVYIRLTYDPAAWPSGLEDINFFIGGRLVEPWDSNGHSQPPGVYNYYSFNPIDHIVSYLTDPIIGKRLPRDDLDYLAAAQAWNYCNEVVGPDLWGETGYTDYRYRASPVINPEARMYDNLLELLKTCRGYITTSNFYKIKVDKPEDTASVPSITDDNIVGEVQYTPGNKNVLLNEVRGKFSNIDWENINSNGGRFAEDFVVVTSPALKATDAGTLSAEYVLPYTIEPSTVQRILTEELNQSRQSGTVKVTTTMELFDVEVGDVVKFTEHSLGQQDKLYRVTTMTINTDYTLTFGLVEYDDNIYWDNNPGILLNNKDDTYF